MRFVTSFIFDFGIINFFSLCLLITNLFTFFLYVLDKRKAERGKRRISEKTLLFFTLAFGGIGAWLGMLLARHKTKKLKFKVIMAIGLIITLIPIVHIVDGLTMSKVIRYTEVEHRSENWPKELDGYRIAFMADMHIITDAEMKNVATELNKRNLDLMLLGGDFLMENDHYKGTVKEIAQINAKDGIFGVEGNHDDYQKVFKEKEKHGIKPLDNSGIQIKTSFYLAGIQDKYNRNPNIEKAIEGAGENDFVLLLSHSPDVAMVQPTKGTDLILSGHIHAGQITFFGYPFYLICGSLPITEYGTKFTYGFAESADNVPVFTTSGIGTFSHVPRIFAEPEVVIFTMYSK